MHKTCHACAFAIMCILVHECGYVHGEMYRLVIVNSCVSTVWSYVCLHVFVNVCVYVSPYVLCMQPTSETTNVQSPYILDSSVLFYPKVR